MILRVEGLIKSFTGRRVIDECTFSVEEGRITGLIGPNGSGKSTVLNLINGLLQPDGGEIIFQGESIVGLKPHQIAARGIGRTFQLTRVFDRMTVLQNLMVSVTYERRPTHFEERARSALRMVGLENLRERPASKLSYGQRKLLEIARVLMLAPKLVLMDEPFAGVNPVLREKIAGLVRNLRDHGITFVIIGHEMKEMMSLCEHVIVLDFGKVLCEGPPSIIQEDERVLEAYFGRRRRWAGDPA